MRLTRPMAMLNTVVVVVVKEREREREKAVKVRAPHFSFFRPIRIPNPLHVRPSCPAHRHPLNPFPTPFPVTLLSLFHHTTLLTDMKLTTTFLLSTFALASTVFADASLPDKLQVGVKYRPEVCEDKSQAGDLLAM